jgi:hypothetical protein
MSFTAANVRYAVTGIARYVPHRTRWLIKQDKIAIGGEESAGLSIRHHVPEKDGILAGLLLRVRGPARQVAATADS